MGVRKVDIWEGYEADLWEEEIGVRQRKMRKIKNWKGVVWHLCKHSLVFRFPYTLSQKHTLDSLFIDKVCLDGL